MRNDIGLLRSTHGGRGRFLAGRVEFGVSWRQEEELGW